MVLTNGPVFSEPRIVPYEKIPEKLEQYRDQNGFLWQVNGSGSITSGETQYLPSGLKLFIGQSPFQPATGTLSDDTESRGVIDLSLRGKRDNLAVERRFWFDLARGGVRILDTFENTGKSPIEVEVELKSAFQFPWQNLIGSSGRILGGAAVTLSPRDIGLAAKFSNSDGRQDTLLIVRGTRDDRGPEISASSNHRELVLAYPLRIAPGKKTTLVHWILRRNFGQISDVSRAVRPFFDRRQLINARIPGELVETVLNFDRSAFPDSSSPPPSLSRLIALNELVDRVGVHRKNEDILWLNPNNQLTGKIDPAASVGIGGLSIPVRQIAAILGGGGLGRTPRVFLRDGQVHTGKIELRGFAMKSGEDWIARKWNGDELSLLLLSLAPSDGVPPPSANGFVELRNGEVFAVSSMDSGFSAVSVLGKHRLPFDQFLDLQYHRLPAPGFRLRQANGSSLSLFLDPQNVRFVDVSGNTRSVDPRLILRVWKTEELLGSLGGFDRRWFDWEDIPDHLQVESGFLLRGNQVLAGGFAQNDPFTVIDSYSVFEVNPAQVHRARRLDEPGLDHSDQPPRFEFELKNGDTLTGRIQSDAIRIGTEEESWLIPVRQILEFQSKTSERREP